MIGSKIKNEYKEFKQNDRGSNLVCIFLNNARFFTHLNNNLLLKIFYLYFFNFLFDKIKTESKRDSFRQNHIYSKLDILKPDILKI